MFAQTFGDRWSQWVYYARMKRVLHAGGVIRNTPKARHRKGRAIPERTYDIPPDRRRFVNCFESKNLKQERLPAF